MTGPHWRPEAYALYERLPRQGTGGYDFYRKCRVVKRIGSEVPQMALWYLREHETVQIETRE